MEVKLRGFDEFERALKVLPNRAEQRVLRSAAMGAIRVGRKELKSAAPRGSQVSSVQKKYGYKPLHKSLKVKSLKPKYKDTRSALVHTGDAFWAYFYEKGTRNQPARPFWGLAFTRAENTMMQEAMTKMTRGINRELDKLGIK